jgi:hypothetical protein
VISQIDDALRSLVREDALSGASDVDVVLDAPTRDWAARRNAPTVNLYLYDIREDLRRREAGFLESVANGSVVSRRPVPRYFKLSYLVTAWTKRPEDEHRLLASVMRTFLKFDAIPSRLVPNLVAGGLVVPITVALPPPEDRAFADVWTALGGELKPSLDIVVTAPMDTGQPKDAGAPVTDGAYVSMVDTVHGGSDHRVHRHVPPPEREAAERTAGSTQHRGGTVRQPGRGRKPRSQRSGS